MATGQQCPRTVFSRKRDRPEDIELAGADSRNGITVTVDVSLTGAEAITH